MRPVVENAADFLAQGAPTFLAGLNVQIAPPSKGLAPRQIEAQEVDALLANVHDSGFDFVERQPLGLQPLLEPRYQPSAMPASAGDDEVIGLAHHAGVAGGFIVDSVVQRIEVEVGQQGRDDPALRRAASVG